MTCTI